MPAKKKEKVSKGVAVSSASDNTGLSVEVLKQLASYGVIPRVEHDKVPKGHTGSLRLDWVMGGGIPKKRLTTLTGKRKTGKTTLATIICREEINRGGKVAYIDTENKFNADWAASLGVDLSRFVMLPVRTGEQLINTMKFLLTQDVFDGYVIDSIRGTTWDAEDSAEAEQMHMGIAGRMWNRFSRICSGPLEQSKAWMLALNGVYASMEPMSKEMIEPGGTGIPYMAALRLRTQPPIKVEGSDEITFKVKCLETQVGGRDGREGAVTVTYLGENKAIVNPLPDMSAMAKELNAVKTSGAWFYVGDGKYQGEAKFQEAMRDDPELYDYVFDAIMDKLTNEPPALSHEDLLEEPLTQEELDLFDEDALTQIEYDEIDEEAGDNMYL